MEIENTQLYLEIKQIIDEGPKPVNYYYTCNFIVEDKKYQPLKVLSMSIKRDYINGYGDDKIITVSIPNGLWAKVIYPNLHILDIVLIKTPIYEVSEITEEDKQIEEVRYTAIPVTETSPTAVGAGIQRLSIAALDTTGYMDIDFQLVDKGIEVLSMVSSGMILRRCKTFEAIQAILAKESKVAKTITGPAVKKISVVKGDNEVEREHIIIPHGTKLIDIPSYIQRECGGVYESGINSYFQDKGWYVYPLYNVKRFNKEKKKLVILKVPKQRFTSIERTYRVEGDIIYGIGTSDSDFTDQTFINTRNAGDGIRLGDSRQILRDIVEKKGNKAIYAEDGNNHEFVFEKKKDLPKYRKHYNIQLSANYLNSNLYVEKSKLDMANGAMYEMDWENSNPDLLYPGMPVKIIYLDKDEFKEIFGVLSYVLGVTQLKGQAITSKRHTTTTKIVVFCSSITKVEQTYDDIDNATIKNWEEYEMG